MPLLSSRPRFPTWVLLSGGRCHPPPGLFSQSPPQPATRPVAQLKIYFLPRVKPDARRGLVGTKDAFPLSGAAPPGEAVLTFLSG